MSKGLRVALLGCLVSALLLYVAADQPWADVAYPDRARTVDGGRLVGSVKVWALVALAGVPAVLATRRRARILVGGVLTAAGASAAALTVDAIREIEYRVVEDAFLRRVLVSPEAVDLTGWPYVALAAGVLLAATGVLVALRGPRWAALSSRFDNPADRPVTDADVWAAQDRGEDPTA